ncbi:phospholipase A1 EG1, chloroplastic/mitochondrial-like [Aegilops tauschii subsp. strangulata]|uniref:phospholipase A1 EG1, chloroplastic/mitochondrial-like n=1 Tax=Aegilops tauschii subsp. strangulata TaxID=200361 RepID=UPI003CC85CED
MAGHVTEGLRSWGCGDWEGLLGLYGPAPALPSYVARYGELVDTCYKASDLDHASRWYLNCKYGKERMLEEVGMVGAWYEVIKYIYAYAAPNVTMPMMEVSTSGRSRWIGYVAVSTDEMPRRLKRRDMLVSFRSTVTPAKWMANFMSSVERARLEPCDPGPDVMVELVFLSLYTPPTRRVASYLRRFKPTSAIAAVPVASVAGMWRQLQGCGGWEGLLGLNDPTPALRS